MKIVGSIIIFLLSISIVAAIRDTINTNATHTSTILEYKIAFKFYQPTFQDKGRANIYYNNHLKFIDIVYVDGEDYIIRLLREEQNRDTYARDVYVTQAQYNEMQIGQIIKLDISRMTEDKNNYVKSNT